MSKLVLLAPLLALLLYLPALGNGYAQDDVPVVQVNPLVLELHPVADYFGAHYWHGVGAPSNLYRPVTILSFALTRHVFGGTPEQDAWVQHLVNVLWHALATGLVGVLLLRLAVPPAPAAAGALVFGLAAIKCEAVATLVGRAELLGFGLGAMATLLVLRAARASGLAARLGFALPAALGFLLAFCAKENALGWLALAPLVALASSWRAGRPARGPVLTALACTLPAAAVFLVLRAQALAAVTGVPQVIHAVNPLHDADTATRVISGTVLWAYGLLKMLVPYPLVSDYGGPTFALHGSVLDPWFLAALVVLLALAAATLLGARRWPLLALAGAAFFVFTAPISNVPVPTGTIFAERLFYAPGLAFALAAAWLVERRLAPRVVAVVLGAWLLANVVIVLGRIPAWHDDATLSLRDVEINPRAPRLHLSAAEIHYQLAHVNPAERTRHLQRGIDHLRLALDLDPEYGAAWQNLGAFLLEPGDLRDAVRAEAALRQGLRARHLLPHEARMLRVNLIRALQQQGRKAEATALWRELRADPELDPQMRADLEQHLK